MQLPTFGATSNYDPQTGSGPCPQVGGENANKKSRLSRGVLYLSCEDQAWKELDYGALRKGCVMRGVSAKCAPPFGAMAAWCFHV